MADASPLPDHKPTSIPTAAAATYALVGWPLGFSLSPALHNAAFAATGIDARYVLRPTAPAELHTVVHALREGELAGANVTVPHKVEIRRVLDDESELATAIGAVNTIVHTPAGLRGENTDPVGFRHALEAVEALDGRGKRAIVLGAGGAARAAVHTLLRAGYAVKILSRGSAQSGVLAAQLYRAHPGALLATGPLTPEGIAAEAVSADLLINATPVGSGPATQMPAALWPVDVAIPAHLTVVDLVAWPLETSLVTHARASGARASGGFEMLLGQAAHAFTLWTGLPAPTEAMRSAAFSAAAENSPSPASFGRASHGGKPPRRMKMV